MADEKISDLLDTPLGELPEPVVLPTGRYAFVVTNFGRYTTGEKETDEVSWRIKPVEVVDADVELADQTFEPVQFRQYITKAALAANAPHISARYFLEGVLDISEGTPLREAFDKAIGERFEAQVVSKEVNSKNSKTGKKWITEVARVFPAS
jgi:hypothetical protein